MMPLRTALVSSAAVLTTIPSAAGTVHDAWLPGGPPSSNLTTHMRHAPKAFMPG